MPETTQFNNADSAANFDGALKPGTILLGRYEVAAVMGGGGQGAVYQARDRNFPAARRLVAVKEMHVTAADPSQRAASIRTFQREANLLATLSHPAIPKVYEFFDQNDRAYIVMEYINGSDLEALLVKTKRLPMDKIIEWAIDLCDVLYYLHSYQPEPIIFRDMKPANIMIDSLGKVRLIDFGIAKIFDSGVKRHTQIGTEGYSAPEQYKGLVTPLSDIYGLGATLHHVITREDPRLQAPFTFVERPLERYNPEATPQLKAIIEKALSFEPENRFKTCLEMKQAFEALRYKAAPVVAPVPGAAPSPAVSPAQAAPSAATGFIDTATEKETAVKPRWIFKTEDEIRGGATAFGSVAFVGSYDTNLWAINLETGAFIWKYATEGGIVSTPVADRETGHVFFGSEDYKFYALDLKTGRLNWSHTTQDKIRTSGKLAHGYIFFGSDDGKVYALQAANGRQLWAYDAGVEVRSTPCITNDRVIFGTEAGEVIGLELNGSKKWSYKTRKKVTGSPYVDEDGLCYVTSWDGFLYAIDASSGYSHWRFRTNGAIISSPAVYNGIAYVTSTDGRLYAININTGKEKWTFDAGRPIIATPTVTSDTVYFGIDDGTFIAVDLKTGRENWRYKTNGPITAAAVATNEVVLIGSSDATLYAFPIIKR
jgi:outer membrane protein assembly factor BamB/predicted Ser/Thr protein kinase